MKGKKELEEIRAANEKLVKELEAEKYKFTPDEKELIENRRRLLEANLGDSPEAWDIAVMCDGDYKRFNMLLKHAQGWVFKLAIEKNMLDKNLIDLEKGETKQKFKDGSKQELVDLEIANIQIENGIQEGIESIREVFLEIFRHRGIMRVDKKIYFTDEQWTKYIADMKGKLEKFGINILKERL